MNDILDMAELAEAMRLAGVNRSVETAYSPIGQVVGTRIRVLRGERWWTGEGEHPNLAFAFRDAVRSVLRGSYCAPTLAEPDAEGDWPLCVIPRDADMRFPEGIPMLVYGRTETECWARALVALFRAGLIGEGRG